MHVGREDFQVKIRGFRIDVAEVEVALRAIEGIETAVVVGRQDGTSRTAIGRLLCSDDAIRPSPLPSYARVLLECCRII